MNSEKKINFQLSGENTYESFLWGHQTLVIAKPDENIMIKANYRPVLLVAGEGNGTPLQYSCLENPMDGGGW